MQYITTLGDYILMGDLNAKIPSLETPNRVGIGLDSTLRTIDGIILNKKHYSTFYRYVFGE